MAREMESSCMRRTVERPMVERVAAAVVRISIRGEEESEARPVQTSGVAVQVEAAASEESML